MRFAIIMMMIINELMIDKCCTGYKVSDSNGYRVFDSNAYKVFDSNGGNNIQYSDLVCMSKLIGNRIFIIIIMIARLS